MGVGLTRPCHHGRVSETAETYTCASCGETFPKGWSDEEAAAEAQENFPGIDITDPAEAGVVCDACYQHIMARARAEAPELIGPGWRGESADPIGDALRADAEDARDEIRAAGLMDDLWFRETIVFARDVIGTGPGAFTGLLGILNGEDG